MTDNKWNQGKESKDEKKAMSGDYSCNICYWPLINTQKCEEFWWICKKKQENGQKK